MAAEIDAILDGLRRFDRDVTSVGFEAGTLTQYLTADFLDDSETPDLLPMPQDPQTWSFPSIPHRPRGGAKLKASWKLPPNNFS